MPSRYPYVHVRDPSILVMSECYNQFSIRFKEPIVRSDTIITFRRTGGRTCHIDQQ